MIDPRRMVGGDGLKTSVAAGRRCGNDAGPPAVVVGMDAIDQTRIGAQRPVHPTLSRRVLVYALL